MAFPTTKQRWRPPDINSFLRRLSPEGQEVFWDADRRGYLVIGADDRGVKLDVLWRKWCRDNADIHLCVWIWHSTASLGFGFFREDGLYKPLDLTDLAEIEESLNRMGVKTPNRIKKTNFYWELERVPLDQIHPVCREIRYFYGLSNAPREEEKPRRRALSLRTRFRILKRDGYCCTICGRDFASDGVKLEVDHIIPVSKGGDDSDDNLHCLCFDCNRGKSDSDL